MLHAAPDLVITRYDQMAGVRDEATDEAWMCCKLLVSMTRVATIHKDGQDQPAAIEHTDSKEDNAESGMCTGAPTPTKRKYVRKSASSSSSAPSSDNSTSFSQQQQPPELQSQSSATASQRESTAQTVANAGAEVEASTGSAASGASHSDCTFSLRALTDTQPAGVTSYHCGKYIFRTDPRHRVVGLFTVFRVLFEKPAADCDAFAERPAEEEEEEAAEEEGER